MPGAMVEVRQQASYPEAKNALVATATTDSKGDWKIRVPKGPSATCSPSAIARAATTRPSPHSFSTTRRSRPDVQPVCPPTRLPGMGVRLPRLPRRRLLPPGGALVSLEIFFAGEWREIALLRTNHRGHSPTTTPSPRSARRPTVSGCAAPYGGLSVRVGGESRRALFG